METSINSGRGGDSVRLCLEPIDERDRREYKLLHHNLSRPPDTLVGCLHRQGNEQ